MLQNLTVENSTLPTKSDLTKILSWVLGILTAVFGFLFVQTRSDIDALKSKQVEIQVNQARMIESLKRIEEKIDEE
jgi:hypothetical protein